MRLIDADELKKAVSDSYSDLFRGKALEFGLEGIVAGLAMTSALIDSAETIDAPEANVEPVIRVGEEWTLRCWARYCPNCGAKMCE